MLKRVNLLFLFIFLAFSAFANESDLEKHYCSSEQIELSDSIILVHLDKRTVEIDSLLVDQGGIYFSEKAMRCFYCRRPLNPKNTCECPFACE